MSPAERPNIAKPRAAKTISDVPASNAIDLNAYKNTSVMPLQRGVAIDRRERRFRITHFYLGRPSSKRESTTCQSSRS
jgi:hypothetical protein